jgi:NAD(P)-dependent dehydrogenase (short-subunit alcohol dehydrogenase family)
MSGRSGKARLAGKRAIVIGSATGIGAAAARRLADEGARVVLADIALEKAEAVAADIRSRGGEALAAHVDISDAVAVAALMTDTAARWGGIDVLHNNAAALTAEVGGADARVPIGELPLDVWDETMRINLRGFLLACREAIPHMLSGGGGSIVNTSSAAALAPMTTSGAYAVSKGAINTLTMTIATHYGRHRVRCNSICPGFIDTGHLTEEYNSMGVRHCLLPRIGAPQDIAGVVAFLASDDAAYMTGQVLVVDGGLTVPAPTYAELSAEMVAGMSTARHR